MDNEMTFQSILLKRLLEPSDKALVIDPQPGITKMELIVNDLLHTLMNCKHEENYVGLFECIFKTAFGNFEETRTVKYQSNEFSDVLRAAQKIIDQGGE